MAKGIFTDKNAEPSTTEIENVLGNNVYLWNDLIEYVDSNFKTSRAFKFYGKNLGWALNFKRTGKSFVSLYPADSYVTAQIILKDQLIDKLPTSMKTSKIKKAVNHSTPYSEGRWLFIPVETKKDSEIIKRMLNIKAGIK